MRRESFLTDRRVAEQTGTIRAGFKIEEACAGVQTVPVADNRLTFSLVVPDFVGARDPVVGTGRVAFGTDTDVMVVYVLDVFGIVHDVQDIGVTVDVQNVFGIVGNSGVTPHVNAVDTGGVIDIAADDIEILDVTHDVRAAVIARYVLATASEREGDNNRQT